LQPIYVSGILVMDNPFKSIRDSGKEHARLNHTNAYGSVTKRNWGVKKPLSPQAIAVRRGP
jgi:hypothetical protein